MRMIREKHPYGRCTAVWLHSQTAFNHPVHIYSVPACEPTWPSGGNVNPAFRPGLGCASNEAASVHWGLYDVRHTSTYKRIKRGASFEARNGREDTVVCRPHRGWNDIVDSLTWQSKAPECYVVRATMLRCYATVCRERPRNVIVGGCVVKATNEKRLLIQSFLCHQWVTDEFNQYLGGVSSKIQLNVF